MFCLSELEDTVRVPPDLLNGPLEDAITTVLQKLFLDKVRSLLFCFFFFLVNIYTLTNLMKVDVFFDISKVLSIGLCVSIYDIRSVEGGFVLPGDGAATYKVIYIFKITHLFMKILYFKSFHHVLLLISFVLFLMIVR